MATADLVIAGGVSCQLVTIIARQLAFEVVMCRTVDSSCLGSVRTTANFQLARVVGSHIKTGIHITSGTFLDSISIAVCTCSASSIGTGTDLELASVIDSFVETVKTREAFGVTVRPTCRTGDPSSVHASAFLEVA